jgi:NADH pyrophosphatase NudC (nudix superfamily)
MAKEALEATFEEHGENATCAGQQSENVAASNKTIWIRYCPHCDKKLCKTTLQYSIVCTGCGWVWQ